MDEEKSKVSKRLIWIVITALVGAIITAIVATISKEVQKEEPKMNAAASFNGTTAKTRDGVLRSTISLTNEGNQTLYNVEISGDFTPSAGFKIIDPGVREYGGSVNCSAVVDTTTVSPRFSALCAYLNPGDYWQIEVWHLGIMHGASVLARGKGLSHLEHLSPTLEDIGFSCATLSSEVPKNRINELLPPYCKDRFGY